MSLRWLPAVREAAGYVSGRQTAADTSPATCAGHQPFGQRSFQKRRTVNPPLAPAHSDFLHLAARAA